MSSGAGPVNDEAIEGRYATLKADAVSGGYRLNPDEAFVRDLVRGLLVNAARHGYEACPCRFAMGTRDEDRDIICPCDYRDADLTEHGSCY